MRACVRACVRVYVYERVYVRVCGRACAWSFARACALISKEGASLSFLLVCVRVYVCVCVRVCVEVGVSVCAHFLGKGPRQAFCWCVCMRICVRCAVCGGGGGCNFSMLSWHAACCPDSVFPRVH